MTFTYDKTLSTNLAKVRFAIQDTVENNGIKPHGVNFEDEEINGVLDTEGTVGRAVAALFESLATGYSIYADTQIGSRREALSKIAENFRKRAESQRKEHGYATGNNVISVSSLDEDISQPSTTS